MAVSLDGVRVGSRARARVGVRARVSLRLSLSLTSSVENKPPSKLAVSESIKSTVTSDP